MCTGRLASRRFGPAGRRLRNRAGGIRGSESSHLSLKIYITAAHRPRLSMGIGERRAVPTLADAHQAPGSTADRERDAACGIRSVTNDLGPNYDPSCDAPHVRYYLKSNNKFTEGPTTTTKRTTRRWTRTTAAGRNGFESTRQTADSS